MIWNYFSKHNFVHIPVSIIYKLPWELELLSLFAFLIMSVSTSHSTWVYCIFTSTVNALLGHNNLIMWPTIPTHTIFGKIHKIQLSGYFFFSNIKCWEMFLKKTYRPYILHLLARSPNNQIAVAQSSTYYYFLKCYFMIHLGLLVKCVMPC